MPGATAPKGRAVDTACGKRAVGGALAMGRILAAAGAIAIGGATGGLMLATGLTGNGAPLGTGAVAFGFCNGACGMGAGSGKVTGIAIDGCIVGGLETNGACATVVACRGSAVGGTMGIEE